MTPVPLPSKFCEELARPTNASAKFCQTVRPVESAPSSTLLSSAGTTWSATQSAYPTRNGVAALLGVPADNVRVVFVRGAGCCGINGADTVSFDAALLSQAVGQPVRAYRWATGFERGTVKTVLEAGLRYEIDLGPNRPPAGYFFTALVPP